jgi:hypothetical protein
VTINLDVNLLKKYWLSISATLVGLWTYLTPAAQQQLVHYISVATLGHPILAAAFAVILADLKQSPLAAKVVTPVVEAPQYLANKTPQ